VYCAVRVGVWATESRCETDRASICAAAGVSERHANRILKDLGFSVHGLLIERRLERCRTALKNHSQRWRSIANIALEAGFKDVAHFSTSFKDKYRISPSECRGRRNLIG